MNLYTSCSFSSKCDLGKNNFEINCYRKHLLKQCIHLRQGTMYGTIHTLHTKNRFWVHVLVEVLIKNSDSVCKKIKKNTLLKQRDQRMKLNDQFLHVRYCICIMIHYFKFKYCSKTESLIKQSRRKQIKQIKKTLLFNFFNLTLLTKKSKIIDHMMFDLIESQN